MDRRHLCLAATLLPLVGCSTTGRSNADPAARRAEIDSSVNRALQDLYKQVPDSQQLTSRAAGVLVFPRVITAGLGVGGSFGEGALRKRGGATAGYYSIAGGRIGLIAGAQSKAVYLLFMTPEALSRFENSSGWTAGVDASVAVMQVGANAQATTQTIQQPVIGYVLTNGGLMANLSFDGTKINRLQL